MENNKVKKDNSFATYLRLLRYLKPYRGQFILALFAMCIYGATDGAVPYILKRVLDDIFGNRNESLLWGLVTLIISFAFIRGAFGFLDKYLISSVGLRIIRDIRNQICDKLLALDSNFFSKNSTGSLVSRMSNDTLQVKTALTDAAGAILRDSVRIIVLLCVAIYLDPVLGAIAFIGFPLGIIPVLKFGKKVRKLSRKGQDDFGSLASLLQEFILGSKIVQSFTAEEKEMSRFRIENNNLTDIYRKAEKYGAMSSPVNEVLASLAIAGVILYGGFSVISGVRTQGDFIAFITSMFLLYEPLKKMGRANTTVQTGIAAAERIFEVLDAVPDIRNTNGAIELTAEAPKKISYQDVYFMYPSEKEQREEKYALKGIDLTIETGQTLALVGMSGGGKSTLVNLLARFYDPSKGKILINDIDIRNYTLKSLRGNISIVSQHTFLFNQSVFDNIAYGKNDATIEEVVSAAKAGYADDFINKLPFGYNTVIGEQGLSLSGGERARIAIARALLKDAPILILDEATASLDSEAEKLVQQAIDNLMKNRTVFVIAHRLSTIRNADKIAVFKNGKIIEVGSHQELVNQNTEYSKLYNLQFTDNNISPVRANISNVR
ncbi:MAG: ATP-binding cassette domain-containing protein [Proteobacteria bacterium]|nr:ATP-binding cassette domain-containing protein [Pseudomonadota bacterium]